VIESVQVVKLGKAIFAEEGDADVPMDENDRSQPEFSITRGRRRCPNLIGEVCVRRSTRGLVDQCVAPIVFDMY
jgi:hypothetical protein